MATLVRTNHIPALIAAALLFAAIACSTEPGVGDAAFEPDPTGRATELVLNAETCRSSNPNVVVSVSKIDPTGQSFFIDNHPNLSLGDAVYATVQDDRTGTLRAIIGSNDKASGLLALVSIRRTDDVVVVTPELLHSNDSTTLFGKPLKNLRGTVTLSEGRWTRDSDTMSFAVNITGVTEDGTTLLARGKATVRVPAPR